MKKIIGFVLLAMVVLVPVTVAHAAMTLKPMAERDNADGTKSTGASVNITGNGEKEITVTVKEEGGAKIDENSVKASSDDWEITKSNYSNGVLTVTLSALDSITGEYNLFTLNYTPSGEEDCKIVFGLSNTENKEETPAPAPQPDQPEENKQTGSTLPYIALGGLVLAAGGAYMAIRNKSKMYKI